MALTITLDRDFLTTVVSMFFTEAIKPQLDSMPANLHSNDPQKPLYTFHSKWGEVNCIMEYRQVFTGNGETVRKRYFWKLACPSKTGKDSVYQCPQTSPESLLKKILIQFPKKPLVNIFSYFLKYYLGREYCCIIDDHGRYIDLENERCLDVLRMKYKEACYCAFSSKPSISPTITVSKMSSDEDSFPDLDSFYKKFFTAQIDGQYENSVDRFRQICRLWKVDYDQLSIPIEKVSSLFNEDCNRRMIQNSIIKESCRFPLFNSLLKSKKYNELHSLLRELCTLNISQTGIDLTVIPSMQPPAQAISDRVLGPVLQRMGEKEYTAYDYILVLGKYAELSGKVNNVHSFNYSEIEEDDMPFIKDALRNRLIEQTEDSGRILFKFRLKQMRLFTAAMASALNDTTTWRLSPTYPRVQEGIKRLLNIRGTELEEKQNKEESHAAKHFSAESFYALCYLEYTDSLNRRDLIDSLITIASNFHIENGARIRQEKAISILSYLLLEKGHEYPSAYRLKLFEAAFGQTLYKPQSEMWSQLKQRSAFYAHYAKEQFIKACKLIKPTESKTANDTNIVAADQPLFNFLQADLYDKEDITTLQKSMKVLLKCCKIQRDTWYLSSDNSMVSQSFVHDSFKLIEECVKAIEANPDGDDSLHYVYGLSMVFYGLANLKYQHIYNKSHEVEELINSKDYNAGRLFKAILLCDYWNRRRNLIYDTGSLDEKYYLLAGSIRFICSYNLNEAIGFPIMINSLQISDIENRYKKWLKFERKNNLRYYYLILRLLSYTDFDVKKYMDRSEFYRTEFLPYDNISRDYVVFYKDPRKI